METQMLGCQAAPQATADEAAVPTVTVKRPGGAPPAGLGPASAAEIARLAGWATASGGEPILAD